jgi:hypothetical protein
MPKPNRLTNNSDETDISALLSGDNVFAVPYFQRAYKWKPEKLKRLERDILANVDTGEMHFLGAVILHGRQRNPSDPGIFEVIDGQQRITTLFLYVAATVRTLADLGETSEAANLFLKYLVINRDTNLISNLKLHPGKEDRAQLNHVLTHVIQSAALKERLGSFAAKFLPISGKDTGPLRNNYKTALRFLKHENDQGGIDRVRSVYSTLLQGMSVVQIDVSDPTNGPKIFDSLNSQQEPMTIGDLVRNEIFSRVANEQPSEIEYVDLNSWQPFYKKFQQDGKNLFDNYFFPYGLTQNPNIPKSEVYNTLREQWRTIPDPQSIIAALSRFQDAFIDITSGTNLMGHSKPVAHAFRNLWRSQSPSSIYPFLMPLSKAIQEKVVSEALGSEVLETLESFLVRRAVLGIEPTGLHAVFKRLWVDCEGKPSREKVKKEISKHKTVVWPNDEEFREAIRHRRLYGVGVTRYLLMEYDASLGGDTPKDIPWIEHVLPETPAKQWWKFFTKEQHHDQKDLFANLIPLSQVMNSSVSNKQYSEKRERYRKDSMFKSARAFADKLAEWTPERLEKRGIELADWAVRRWHD